MNPELNYIVAGVTLLIQGITAAYVYGKLTQKVSDLQEDVQDQRRSLRSHAKAIVDVREEVARHGQALEEHERRITHLEAPSA